MKKALMIGVLGVWALMGQDSGLPKGPSDSESVVPEPATMGLMAAGLGAIAFGAWRKTRKR